MFNSNSASKDSRNYSTEYGTQARENSGRQSRKDRRKKNQEEQEGKNSERKKAVFAYIRKINYFGIIGLGLYLAAVNLGWEYTWMGIIGFGCCLYAFITRKRHKLNFFGYVGLFFSTLLMISLVIIPYGLKLFFRYF